MNEFFDWMKEPLFAAVATSAFSVLFGLHSTEVLLAAAGAAVGRAAYQFVPDMGSEAFAAFMSALAAGVYSELVGWFRKRPATVYMIASIIPLVPGGGMYYTVLASLEGESLNAVELGLATMMTAFALAAGLAVANALGRHLFPRQVHMRLRRKRGA